MPVPCCADGGVFLIMATAAQQDGVCSGHLRVVTRHRIPGTRRESLRTRSLFHQTSFNFKTPCCTKGANKQGLHQKAGRSCQVWARAGPEQRLRNRYSAPYSASPRIPFYSAATIPPIINLVVSDVLGSPHVRRHGANPQRERCGASIRPG